MSAFDSLLSAYVTDDGLTVFNPATGKKIATVRDYTPEEVRPLIQKSAKAFPLWAAKTAKERATILRKWHDLIIQHITEISALITAEGGKPLVEGRGEVLYGASFIEWFAEEAKRLYGDTIPHHAPGRRLMTLKQPVGVTAAITPWNFPIAMITRKAAPALAAGCSMIVKPAAQTPLTALAIEKLAHEAGVPRDIFRVVSSSNAAGIGDEFCENSLIRKLSFTGSTPVGKALMARSAQTVKKVSMELGGNAPFIVFDDADIDAAVEGAIASKYRNAGQTCVCANRFLVHEKVHDEFVQKFADKVKNFKIGNGVEDGVNIGPLIDGRAIAAVAELVARAKRDGATVYLGGNKIDREGCFFQPTILTGVTHEMCISQSEIFGPVAPIIRFCNDEEAITIANDTPFGLAAYFYANDLGRVWRVMEKLEYGMVGINEGIISTEVAPFGGIKESGIGREGSRYGMDEYIELKYCLIGGLSS